MKTERNIEEAASENELVNLVGGQLGKLGPYAKIIGAALLLFFAVYFVSKSMAARSAETAARGWEAFRDAAAHRDILGLREVADEYPGTPAAAWGRQTAGDLSLATGSSAMYGNREIAMDRLKEAKEDFTAASAIAKDPLLKQSSLMGLAQSNEALNEFDEAAECYEKVISNWPNEAIGKAAQSRLAFLKQPSTTEFYDWFVKQEVEVAPPIPELGGSIKPPSVYGDLPSNPGLKLPGVGDLGDGPGVGDDLTAPESGSDTEPATDDGAATEVEPATDAATSAKE